MAARRKYNWEEWFERDLTVLLRGSDYHCSQSTMVQTVRNNASQRGVRVRVTDTDDSVVIRVVGRTHALPHTDSATVPV